MAIKLKFEIRNIEIEKSILNVGNGVVMLEVDNQYVVGKKSSGADIAGGDSFKKRDAPATTKVLRDISHVVIECDEKNAELLARLVKLRGSLRSGAGVKNATAGGSPEKSLYTLDNVPLIGATGASAGGFNTVDEILQANANGFTISSRGGAMATIGNNALVEKQADGTTDNANAKTNIDNIKKLIVDKKFTGFKMFDSTQTVAAAVSNASKSLFGKEFTPFATLKPTARELIAFHYYKNTDPKELRGFKPGDITAAGYGGHGEDMSTINLAFFGKHYFVDVAGTTSRIDERYQKDDLNCLLYFNEQCGGDSGNVYNKTTNLFDGAAGNARDKVDKAYGVVSAFLTEWVKYADKDYSTKNKNNDKTELESDKAALEILKKYKKAVLTSGPQTKKFNKVGELDSLITAATDGSDKEKVYQAFKVLPDTDAKKTDAVFDALKMLVDKLDGMIDKPSDLEALSTGGDKKTAWDMVNDNTKDSSGKG
ncbi:7786_t:CDS:2 [Scutellospora calospora]|uniref:7786_t:CDS:1 n=1 Tax=Scutellospora calospora TaxID=85575 RepID=A0ACA9LYI8_9GLOM|nr:7786_t:CDS:2 [Scutellospora calospora]